MNTSFGKCFRGSSSLHTSKIFTSDNKTRMPPTTPVNYYPWHANPQSGPRVLSSQRQFIHHKRMPVTLSTHTQQTDRHHPYHTQHRTHTVRLTRTDRQTQTQTRAHTDGVKCKSIFVARLSQTRVRLECGQVRVTSLKAMETGVRACNGVKSTHRLTLSLSSCLLCA